MHSNTFNISLSGAVTKKKAWQVKEPEDKNDPSHHEIFSVKEIDSKRRILGASIRGKNHAHRGKYRDDAFHYDAKNGFIILAVADGAGSSSLSRVGAEIAVTNAVKSIKMSIDNNDAIQDALEKQCADNIIEGALEDAVLFAIESIKNESEDRNISTKQFATTLTLVVTWPQGPTHQIMSLQVGDGLIMVSGKNRPVSILGVQDRGQYSSQSKFITSNDIVPTLKSRVSKISMVNEDGFIAVLTDGIADDF